MYQVRERKIRERRIETTKSYQTKMYLEKERNIRKRRISEKETFFFCHVSYKKEKKGTTKNFLVSQIFSANQSSPTKVLDCQFLAPQDDFSNKDHVEDIENSIGLFGTSTTFAFCLNPKLYILIHRLSILHFLLFRIICD